MNNTGKYIFLPLMFLIIISLCNNGYAGENTFEISPKNENKSHADAATDFLNKQEHIYLEEILRASHHADETKKSDGNNGAKPEGLRARDLNSLLRVEDIRAQMDGAVHTGQIQGLRKLLYIVILTDDGISSSASFDQLRYQIIIVTSENILKLARLQTGVPRETRMSGKAETMVKEFTKNARRPQAFKPGDEWLPEARRRPFVGMIWQGQSYDMHAEAPKPRSLGRRY